MMRQNFYNEFASIYDELMVDVDYRQWAEFITETLKNNSKSLLEAACGTGNVTSYIARQGFLITAFDLSEEMLVKAYEKTRRFRNVRLLNQNMTNFKIDSKFDACICCCDAINYLCPSDTELFFNKVNSHLKDNGKFIFDISTEYKYLNMKNTYVYDDDNIFYVWENTINDNKDTEKTIQMEINFFIKQEEDKYSRVTELQTHYLHNTEDIIRKLSDAGFTNIKVFDGYTQNIIKDSSIRATFVCEKSI